MPTYPLDPVQMLLQQVGELNGKADGILRELKDIKDDNVQCHADRDNLYAELGKVKTQVAYYSGAASIFGMIGGWISYHFWPIVHS